MLTKIAFGAFLSFLPTGHAGQIHIQDQPVGAVGVGSRLAVLTEERGENLLHLTHVLGGRCIQRLLRDRLFRAALPTHTLLQGWIRAQKRIELHKALGTREQGHQDIDQFVLWAIFDGLLRDLHASTHDVEDAASVQMSRQGYR